MRCHGRLRREGPGSVSKAEESVEAARLALKEAREKRHVAKTELDEATTTRDNSKDFVVLEPEMARWGPRSSS